MKKIISVLMLTLAVGSLAFTQGPPGGGQRGGQRGGAAFGRAGAQYGLLSHADIQTALKITDDEKTKLEAAATARRDAMQGAQGDRAAITKAMEDYNTAVAGALSSDQKTQLLNIFVL